jgi:hypothetical protein
MRYTDFEEANRTLGAGDNPNTGDLRVVTAIDPETPGVGMIISCWEPSAEELAEFLKTKKIYLGVMCNLQAPTQPPVCIYGFNPFLYHGFKVIQHKNEAQRMFEGPVDILDLVTFEYEGRKFSMTVSGGENTFILEEVVEILDGALGDSFGPRTKEYFKAWEILAAKYKEI